ncbi:Autophagy protein 5 [Strongyloides ratti]|uniref:Autophagy protein 5 n=1 Tax=Strongyloides ratti TaxID=34506 RepID=A0A090LI94_STRRB|nr:Autophagy protein 5 [Strongyloides ratti]CEF69541.1 Autophagy protein 5 [Strongyloides ratti]
MDNDYQVRRLVWDAEVPIMFILDKGDFPSTSNDTYLISLPRVSYFPFFYKNICSFFSNFGEQISELSIYLEYQSEPLRWYYPIGVIHDILSDRESIEPLQIVVRKGISPEDVIRYSPLELEAIFMQSIKEADHLKHKGKVSSRLTRDESRKLVLGLSEHKFDQFWEVNSKLLVDSNNMPISYMPIRFYKTGCRFLQFLIKPEEKLCDLIDMIYKDEEKPLNIEFYCHGIMIPSETITKYLVNNLTYPDSFVHVVIHTNNEK